MSTVFESLGDGFYTAFFEPDPEKRKDKIEAWIKESTPVIQSAVENDLRTYLEEILEATLTEQGWKTRVEKFAGKTSSLARKSEPPDFIDAYKLYLDVKLRRHASRDKDNKVDTLTPEVREKTKEAIETAKTAIAKLEPPTPVDIREINLHENHTVEVAIPIVDEFLKECYRDNVRRVRIIHGKGIGVLRKAVKEELEKHK